jgi:hypothetical protein
MTTVQKDTKGVKNENQRRGMEMLVFLAVSAVGIYSLGQALVGLFEPGQGLHLIWLAVTGVAMMILFAQMGRVQDSWPHREAKNNRGSNQQQTPERGF